MRSCWRTTFTLFCLLMNALWTAVASEGQEVHRPLVTTKYGQVQGAQLGVKGTDRAVNAYFGIPFAKPPLGALRFSPPEPPEPWNNVREAMAYPPMCLQDRKAVQLITTIMQTEVPDFTVSEDCLYLNIYTPADANTLQLPVMVWIHGGGLVAGGASIYDGSALSAYENVVVVTIQYRLGTLGFFSTGDEHARGNWALLDQVAALQWIQENIEPFGGDHDSVTIFGESGGAFSVSALVLSPLSKGLFHKAISESGVAITPGIVCTDQEMVLAINRVIANSTGCDSADSAAVVSCMRKKTAEEILQPILDKKFQMAPAVTDGVFFPKNPDEMLSELMSNPVPYLIGVNTHEMGWIVPITMNIPQTILKEGFDRETVNSLTQMFIPGMGSIPEFVPLAIDEYLGETEDTIMIRDSFLEMLGDIVFILPTVKTATYHREQLQDLIEHDLRDMHHSEGPDNENENAPSTSNAHSVPSERERVRQLLQTDSEPEQNVNVTPSQPQTTPAVSNISMSRRRRQQQFRLSRSAARESGVDADGTFTGNHVEDKILKVQRLQGKDIRIIKGKMGHISEQMGTLASSMNAMINVMKTGHESTTSKLDRIANSLEMMCNLFNKHQKISAKKQEKLLNSMQTHYKEITSLTNCTRALCKQTLSTQVLLMKTFKHIQKGVGASLETSAETQSKASTGNVIENEERGDTSAESGTSQHSLCATRRSVRKQSDATHGKMLTVKSPGKALGVRGHKK